MIVWLTTIKEKINVSDPSENFIEDLMCACIQDYKNK